MSTIGTLVSAGAPATIGMPATASSPEKERITKGGVLAEAARTPAAAVVLQLQ